MTIMKLRTLSLVLLAGVAIGAPVHADASGTKRPLPSYMRGPRPETGAFLNHPAQNIQEVIGQIKLDPEVADRMMRHFEMSKDEVIAYLSPLRQDVLREDGAYIVYNVRDDGVIRARTFSLKKGMKVYVNASGKPILRHICANPMTLGPKRGSTLSSAAVSSEEPMKIVAEDISGSRTEVISASLEPESPTPFAESTPITPPIEPVEQVPIISSGGGDVFGIFTFGLLGSVGVIGSISGGGSNPVPEPSTALLLAPMIYLLARRRKAA